MPTVKDIALDDLRAALIEVRSGIGPLSQMNDDHKSKRETAMYNAILRAFSALHRIEKYESA